MVVRLFRPAGRVGLGVPKMLFGVKPSRNMISINFEQKAAKVAKGSVPNVFASLATFCSTLIKDHERLFEIKSLPYQLLTSLGS